LIVNKVSETIETNERHSAQLKLPRQNFVRSAKRAASNKQTDKRTTHASAAIYI